MFYLADLHNGILISYETELEASKAYEAAVADGLIAEYEMQYESGLTDEEIREKVSSFFLILDEATLQS